MHFLPERFTVREERVYILNYLGSLLALIGLFMYLPLIPYLIFHDQDLHHLSAVTFAGPATFSVLIGLLLQNRIAFRTPSLRGAMVITALGWILAGLVGGLPFMIGLHKSFFDAFFESVSGFTTTGITVFEGLDAMPRSILFWRSFMQWLGGLGILTFFLAVSFRGGSTAAALFSAEGHKIDISRPVPGIFNTLKILWAIYTFFTVVSFVLFLAGGMDVFDAINHACTCISTGGFSTHDASLAYYSQHHFPHAVFLEYAVILIMLAGGTNFLVHFKVMTGHPGALFSGFEMKWYWAILGGSVLLICSNHFSHLTAQGTPGDHLLPQVFREALFQVSSMLTSTGYLTVDIQSPFFPALSKQIFIILMVIGGCVGSTAGGIKVLRFGILVRLFRTQLQRISLPRRAVTPVVVSGKIIPDAELQRIAALCWSWLLLIVLGAILTAAYSDLDPWQSFSGMASAVGNMGPFYFSVHKMASLHWLIKLTYTFGMLAGRLEIIPLACLVGTLKAKERRHLK